MPAIQVHDVHSGIQEELTVGELLEMHGRWYSRSLPPDMLSGSSIGAGSGGAERG